MAPDLKLLEAQALLQQSLTSTRDMEVPARKTKELAMKFTIPASSFGSAPDPMSTSLELDAPYRIRASASRLFVHSHVNLRRSSGK